MVVKVDLIITLFYFLPLERLGLVIINPQGTNPVYIRFYPFCLSIKIVRKIIIFCFKICIYFASNCTYMTDFNSLEVVVAVARHNFNWVKK